MALGIRHMIIDVPVVSSTSIRFKNKDEKHIWITFNLDGNAHYHERIDEQKSYVQNTCCNTLIFLADLM